jgi:hypothetical protein
MAMDLLVKSCSGKEQSSFGTVRGVALDEEKGGWSGGVGDQGIPR